MWPGRDRSPECDDQPTAHTTSIRPIPNADMRRNICDRGENSGPDALTFLNRIFPRDELKVKIGCCSDQFACCHDDAMITDGLLLRIDDDRYWFAQADGDLLA
ncbi:MAG: hypothetical protein ACR2RA_23285 [Geminicoccaceae bacterium]